MFKHLDRPRRPLNDTPAAPRAAGEEGPQLPRATAFIWGGEVRPSPSLPFGRWKEAVLNAA